MHIGWVMTNAEQIECLRGLMFTPTENKPLCDRCLNDDRDGALKARGDLLLCQGCYEGWMGCCDDCGAEVPELSLVDSQLLEGERYCAECGARPVLAGNNLKRKCNGKN